MTRDIMVELGTATLAKAFGERCWMDATISSVWPRATAAGSALTVRTGDMDNLAIHLALEKASQNDLLVVDAGYQRAGFWGELMSIAAIQIGVAGLVIQGGVRDTERIENLRFPVFASGISLEDTRKGDPGQIGIPVTVGGIRVMPGDSVAADSDGVVVIPREKSETVIAKSHEIRNKEQRLMERLVGGESTVEALELRSN